MVLVNIGYLRERLGGSEQVAGSDWLPHRLLGSGAKLGRSRAILIIPSPDDPAFLPHHVMANQRSSHDDDMVLTTQESIPPPSRRRRRRPGLVPTGVPSMLYAVHCFIHCISFLKPVTVTRCLLTDTAASDPIPTYPHVVYAYLRTSPNIFMSVYQPNIALNWRLQEMMSSSFVPPEHHQ